MLASETIHAAIECLGGNGTLEDFSVLPRLLRDCIIYETWEGPHNVLIAQCFRDLQRGTLLDDLVDCLSSALLAVGDPKVKSVAVAASFELSELHRDLSLLLVNTEGEPSWDFRLAIDRLADLFFFSRVCAEEDWRSAHHAGTKNLELLGALKQSLVSSRRVPSASSTTRSRPPKQQQ